MTTETTVLLIDDEWGRVDHPMIRENYAGVPVHWILSTAGEPGGYSVVAATAAVRDAAPNIVLLDISFGPSGDRLGVDILQGIRAEFPALPVIIFTTVESRENRELVIRCMELGANEYVRKAPSPERMLELISVYTDPNADFAIYGNSSPVRQLRAEIARVAFSGDVSVLIVGESGSGKELVARALHRQGPRRNGPFVSKNCAHADNTLLDSELFGHERGAFTGATQHRKGLLEEASRGILFLDEVADMPLELQGKLLRALETRVFRRVGGTKDIESNFQLLCATNRPAANLLKSGRLREDLFYRIATMQISVPPLRERPNDVPILAKRFLANFKILGGASYPGTRLHPEFLTELKSRAWPGNVRELRNVIERAIILSTNEDIDLGMAREPGMATPAEMFAPGCAATIDPSSAEWATVRLISELRLALEVKAHVQKYKGNQWKAEFMRRLYPECKSANAKGFDDLVKRLTSGPWGCPNWQTDSQLSTLIEALRA